LPTRASSPNTGTWSEEKFIPFLKDFESNFPKNFVNTQEEEHSQLFKSIMTLSKEVSESKTEIKTINIYSDLLENNGQISFYKTDISKLKTCDSVLVAKLVAIAGITVPNMKGVVVNLYIPRDSLVDPVSNKDQSTKVAVEASRDFYKQLFEKAGATVNVYQY
jgi:hypothetical protein